MSDIALSTNNLGKMYRVGLFPFSLTARETLTNGIKNAGRNLLHGGAYQMSSIHEFWALRNITFDVPDGEVLGIIGKNGAGKSTLLKILSRVTVPTEGYVDISGTVGSLLEVGIGFHPELSGRENTYIYGTILGLKRSYIDDKFDEIVKFAEIEEFIDTPLKRFSTGMWARLAFSVAATMNPDIMIIDEALSVGDTAFQKKSFSRMRDIARSGRTAILVSHNMDSVRDFCDRVLWLESGKIKNIGDPEKVIESYLAS